MRSWQAMFTDSQYTPFRCETGEIFIRRVRQTHELLQKLRPRTNGAGAGAAVCPGINHVSPDQTTAFYLDAGGYDEVCRRDRSIKYAFFTAYPRKGQKIGRVCDPYHVEIILKIYRFSLLIVSFPHDSRRKGLEKIVLTVKEVAAMLNCGATKAYALIASGEIPSLRLGGRRKAIRVPLDSLNMWLLKATRAK